MQALLTRSGGLLIVNVKCKEKSLSWIPVEKDIFSVVSMLGESKT